MKNLARKIGFLTAAAFVAQMIYYYPILPETVAVHFGASGYADNFTSKANYLLLQIALMLFGLFFSSVQRVFINVLPHSLINIPHREYWLADERRDATLKILQKYFDWISVALLGLFVGINQLAIEANFRNPIKLSDDFWFVLGAFLVFMAFWMYKFMRQFNKME